MPALARQGVGKLSRSYRVGEKAPLVNGSVMCIFAAVFSWLIVFFWVWLASPLLQPRGQGPDQPPPTRRAVLPERRRLRPSPARPNIAPLGGLENVSSPQAEVAILTPRWPIRPKYRRMDA